MIIQMTKTTPTTTTIKTTTLKKKEININNKIKKEIMENKKERIKREDSEEEKKKEKEKKMGMEDLTEEGKINTMTLSVLFTITGIITIIISILLGTIIIVLIIKIIYYKKEQKKIKENVNILYQCMKTMNMTNLGIKLVDCPKREIGCPITLKIKECVNYWKNYEPYMSQHLRAKDDKNKRANHTASTFSSTLRRKSTDTTTMSSYSSTSLKYHSFSKKKKKVGGQNKITPIEMMDEEKFVNKLKMGLKQKIISVMVIDISTYRQSKRSITNTELLLLISEIIKFVKEIIEERYGMIYEVKNDYITCYWNAASMVPNHKLYACRSARMIARNFEKLKDKSTLYECIKPKIALCCGTALCGNIGCESIKQFMIMGSLIKYAKVLLQINKALGKPDIVMNQQMVDKETTYHYSIQQIDVIQFMEQDMIPTASPLYKQTRPKTPITSYKEQTNDSKMTRCVEPIYEMLLHEVEIVSQFNMDQDWLHKQLSEETTSPDPLQSKPELDMFHVLDDSNMTERDFLNRVWTFINDNHLEKAKHLFNQRAIQPSRITQQIKKRLDGEMLMLETDPKIVPFVN